MRAISVSALALGLILLSGGARAQTAAGDGASIADLKEQIARLLQIDADPNTAPEVRLLNRKFIEERRARLRPLLQKKADALRAYRASVASTLTAQELTVIDESIREAESDIQIFSVGLAENSPRAATAAATETAAGSPTADAATAVDSTAGLRTATAPSANISAATPSSTSLLSPTAAPPPPRPELAAAPPPPSTLVPVSRVEASDELSSEVLTRARRLISQVREAQPSPGVTLAQARATELDILAAPVFYSQLVALLVAGKSFPRDQFVRDIEEARIDKQLGGGDQSGGISIVNKGGTPEVLSFAVENGGLTRDISGSIMTFRGNPVGLVEAFQRKGFIPSLQDDSRSAELLRKLSFSVSFDTDRGGEPGTLRANRQQLTGYSLRYEFKNDRDPRNEKYREEWDALIRDHASNLAVDINRVIKLLLTDPRYQAWLDSASAAVGAAAPSELETVILAQLEEFQRIVVSDDLAAQARAFSSTLNTYRRERGRFLEMVAKGPLITFEYLNSRRPDMIDTSTLNFIAETGLFKGTADLTFNGSVTFFNADPGTGMRRVRNFDNSLRLDVPLGDPRRIGNFVLTFAGEYKRLVEDEMMSDGSVMAIKGDVATGQLQLMIPIKGSGLKIPISLTFANRTELIKEREVRGNFGLSFDLDSILQRFKPF